LPHIHEFFDTIRNNLAGFAAIAEILDKAWITDSKSPESGPSHVRFIQEYFDFAQ
tara:strand:+ start:368 stop:532 length:165 start_codon:yes stop_codon:yes gene_type:complete